MNRIPTKVVADNGDSSALIDSIGSPTPFVLTATWSKGKLRIVVEQPQAGAPWPKHEFECPLVECSDGDEGDEDEDDDEDEDEDEGHEAEAQADREREKNIYGDSDKS
jgi:hypothetical protein